MSAASDVGRSSSITATDAGPARADERRRRTRAREPEHENHRRRAAVRLVRTGIVSVLIGRVIGRVVVVVSVLLPLARGSSSDVVDGGVGGGLDAAARDGARGGGPQCLSRGRWSYNGRITVSYDVPQRACRADVARKGWTS